MRSIFGAGWRVVVWKKKRLLWMDVGACHLSETKHDLDLEFWNLDSRQHRGFSLKVSFGF